MADPLMDSLVASLHGTAITKSDFAPETLEGLSKLMRGTSLDDDKAITCYELAVKYRRGK